MNYIDKSPQFFPNVTTVSNLINLNRSYVNCDEMLVFFFLFFFGYMCRWVTSSLTPFIYIYERELKDEKTLNGT